MLRRILPHVCIVLSLTVLVLLILNLFNPFMGFLAFSPARSRCGSCWRCASRPSPRPSSSSGQTAVSDIKNLAFWLLPARCPPAVQIPPED